MCYCMYVAGNFIADIMLKAVHADICIINSSAFRSNRIHPRGNFRKKDLLSILPYNNSIVVIQIKGKNDNFPRMR